MSDAAALPGTAAPRRSRRRRRAASGGLRDGLLAFARFLLPIGIVAMLGVLAAIPFVGGRDISFVLSKDRVQVAHERMRVSAATYRGQDDKGQHFQITATSAVQRSSDDPVVRMRQLTARIQLPDGPASVTAPTGAYDMDRQTVAVDGPVVMRGPDGYRMDTENVDVDLPTRTAQSRSAVTGATDMGTFRADRLHADLAARVVRLDGGVRLHIVRSPARGR